jgi:hypothetical protein
VALPVLWWISAPVDEKVFVTDDVFVLLHNLERIRGLTKVMIYERKWLSGPGKAGLAPCYEL